uniref:NmrA-like domain-containing protein n=1 Tax=Leptocylindrus danicus TaxID=163516 RepID=A0A7S2LKT1_9STRA|mmetsp:Transcript_6201/g.9116  ORF Transcript_6201/g.9116 Transcript_6201/m.9116 type:complete len:732 (+) Transcript_6201:84-2279(+)|eukprot:CAMPEP_0116029600 /NCGR_PEP_ID=MMETSP0321-20121206/16236_1 /TAXON_ID=163516 /ORGANISM="Leptocylindrus danicus var. danicus, Strain B650" /LENGTH=731 /DNA_ID=CAMNT_0003504007 /DNA_START=125 /DNA_END=2320 /DNA_ORIENTATION=+
MSSTMFDQIANKFKVVDDIMEHQPDSNKVALVFGASGEQGRAVLDGLLLHAHYGKIYGVSRNITNAEKLLAEHKQQEHIKGRVHLIEADLAKEESVEKVLMETKAESIFLVTTTDMPPHSKSCKVGEMAEYESIKKFFDTLVKVYNKDKISRHVLFSTADNVERINSMYEKPPIQPLEDGSVVANYSGKGRGAEYAMDLLADINDLKLTLITLPFLHSNFLGAAAPVPNETQTEWTINACLGENAIDMFSTSDLAYLVPAILEKPNEYDKQNLRISAEKITMGEAASYFASLFGKDIIYNPLTFDEMAAMPNLPSAGCMAQLGQYIADPRSAHHIALTEKVMFPRKPQLFKDWLLTHSDACALTNVGLNLDPAPITTVCVFGSTGMEGESVVKGLLKDTRKSYQIRAITSDIDSPKVKELKALDPDRVTIVKANLDDEGSLSKALEGAQGVFLVTDFFNFYHTGKTGFDYRKDVMGEVDEKGEAETDMEELHAKNIIDACEAAKTIKHIVFCTMEDINEMNKELDLGLADSDVGRFDAKARAAAYARKKKLSCTYVLMPMYSEHFFGLLAPEKRIDEETGRESIELAVPMKEDEPLMCMSIDDLGKAVANIFDSYQAVAGHEIGLVTDFVTVTEVAEMITEVFFQEKTNDNKVKGRCVEKRDVTVDEWVEARGTHTKDLGAMFGYFSKTDAVRKRRSVAKTLELCPDAKPFRQWLEANKNNVQFREKLGLR